MPAVLMVAMGLKPAGIWAALVRPEAVPGVTFRRQRRAVLPAPGAGLKNKPGLEVPETALGNGRERSRSTENIELAAV